MKHLFGYTHGPSMEWSTHFAVQIGNTHIYSPKKPVFSLPFPMCSSKHWALFIDGYISQQTRKISEEWLETLDPEKLQSHVPWSTWHGDFHGILIHKPTEQLWHFTAHSGVFTWHIISTQSGKKVFACNTHNLASLLHTLGESIETDPRSLDIFLKMNYLPLHYAWIKGAIKLGASYTAFPNGSIQRHRNIELRPDSSLQFSDEVERFHTLFLEETKRLLQTNLQQSKQNILTLSGGMDSRAVCMYLLDLGADIDKVITISKKGYCDHRIAQDICAEYHIPFHFIEANLSLVLNDWETVTDNIGGSSPFLGPSHMQAVREEIQGENIGILFSGQMGDGYLYGFSKSRLPVPLAQSASGRQLAAIPGLLEEVCKHYQWEEEYLSEEYAVHSVNAGFSLHSEYAYYSSPFMGKELLDWYKTLPVNWKYSRKLFYHWLKNYGKHTLTAFPWESIHAKPNAYWKVRYPRIMPRLQYGLKKLLSPTFRATFQMLPNQYWYQHSQSEQKKLENATREGLLRSVGSEQEYLTQMLASAKLKDRATLLSAERILTWIQP